MLQRNKAGLVKVPFGKTKDGESVDLFVLRNGKGTVAKIMTYGATITELWVADIVYRPLDTELLLAARERGCRTLSGGRMAVHQAVDAFALITGTRPDPDRMTAHFLDLVAADAPLSPALPL